METCSSSSNNNRSNNNNIAAHITMKDKEQVTKEQNSMDIEINKETPDQSKDGEESSNSKENSKNIKKKFVKGKAKKSKKDHNSNEGSEITIDIDESKNPQKSKRATKSQNKKEKRNKILAGYNPFVFFQREKCKNCNFKNIKPSDYMKKLSAQWKNMPDEEKEPYVKMANEFKENAGDDIVEKKLAKEKKKKGKKPKKEKKEKENSSSSEEEEKEEYIKSEKVDSDTSSIKEKGLVENGLSKIQVNDNKKVNQYVYSVVIPFIEQSFEFWKGKGIQKSD